MQKFAPHGYVAQQFTHATPANAVVGDIVGITASLTVDDHGFIGRPIGKIETIAIDKSYVVVALFKPMIVEQTAGTGGVTAGDTVKTSAKNTVVTAAPGTTATDVPLGWGRALNTVAAAGTVFVVPL
jgi:hypothetical protein